MPIPVHRETDSRVCGCTTEVIGQSTVFANNLLISVKNDVDSCGGGSLNASINPSTIFIENLELVVVGSSASADSCCPDDSHCGPTSSTGSPDVFAF